MAGSPGQWWSVDVADASQVGASRRLVARLAEAATLDATAAGQASLVTVELATNLLKHAVRGTLYMRADAGAVDAVAIDHGPGMDLARCFSDGFSTGGTSGTGLGAVRRCATAFDAYSDARGTVLFARVGPSPGPRVGSIAVAVSGEMDSGDAWQFVQSSGGWSLAVADGLGHGDGAAAAAQHVIAAHAAAPGAPGACLADAHRRAQGSRGAAAVVVAQAGPGAELVQAGVGNIAVSVAHANGSRGLASQNGTLGVACPSVRENRAEAPTRGLLIVHSDGLSARWSLDTYPGLQARHPQVIAAVLFRDARRTRDDATVVVLELGGAQ